MTHMTPFLLLLFLHSAASTATATATITLPLSRIPTTESDPPRDIYQHLHRLASATRSRARRSSTTITANTATTETALSPHSYGGYSITLAFGTPPQQMPFIMDTGSDFVWSPCTHNYLCKNCPPPPPKSHFHSFIPKLSSSARILGCLSPKCGWAHHNPDPKTRCNPNNNHNQTQICPPYIIFYGSGSTGGLSLLETLDLDSKRVPEFLIGCSIFSSRQPAGIAGFGRGPASLPSQLGLTKFSFCLLSRRFDDSEKSTPLDLIVAGAGKKTAGVSYTPFLKNPYVATKSQYSVYYYLGLRRIEVGGKHVKIPYSYLAPADPVTGSGGTIIDSGSTFTYMTRGIHGPLVKELERQVNGSYKRDRRIEALTGLGPCFDLAGAKTTTFPSVAFHFKGGAKMELPLANYLVLVGSPPAACFTIVTDVVGAEGAGGAGPAVILGSFQMQNFYVEYDLRNERFGFKQQKCG